MINLMYLVLTALLALNVSNEILNAFKTLSSSIDKSNKSIDAKTSELYAQIKASEQEKGQAEKVRPYREKADVIVKRSQDLIDYLNAWKKRIAEHSGGFGKLDHVQEPEDTAFPANMGDINVTTELLFEKRGGDTIKSKIMELRKFLLEQIPTDSAQISPLMPLTIQLPPKTENNPNRDWSQAYFEHMPSVAAMAMFSKFQNDVRSAEGLVIKRLAELSHSRDLKFDTTAAVAVPSTTYALVGDKIQASILMASFNTTNQPEVSISQGGGNKKPAKNGVIEWETVASGTGMQTVKGTVTLRGTAQGDITRPWSFEYMVGQTGASIGLDKMNVMYIGVPNPITVSAAGYAIGDVYLNVPAGVTQSGSDGHFVINCTNPSPNMTIDIMAKPKTKDGAAVKVGSSPYRVKYIPNPTVYLLNKKDGNLSAAAFRQAIAPIAVLENFEYEAKFRIVEFQFSMYLKSTGEVTNTYTVKSTTACRFGDNPDVAKLQARAKSGDRLFIEGIKGVGPDGKVRPLGSLLFTLN